LSDPSSDPNARRVRIQTQQGEVEGWIAVAPSTRTLDDLNLITRDFIHVRPGSVRIEGWAHGAGTVAINKSTILYVIELSPLKPRTAPAGRYERAPIVLAVGPYGVRGFVHVPPGGDPLARLNVGRHPFIALTSVSIVGPDRELATGFLAVQRQHVIAAQALELREEPVEEEREEMSPAGIPR
jgi:hypothetical protein